jgi:hypothetical protein
LIDQELDQGSHTLSWSAPASGEYLAVLQAGGEQRVVKMVCIR